MKKIIISIIIVIAAVQFSNAQSYNWGAFNECGTHTLGAEFGLEYGMTIGLRYGYYLPVFLPMMFTADVQIPFGYQVMDDVKARIGVQLQMPAIQDFRFIVKYNLVSKRFNNPYTRQYSFGNEIGLIAGYYRQKWFVAAEFSYDNTSISHIHHSENYLDFYPDAKDGWYKNFAGNFYYGLQGGYSFKNIDLSLKVGQPRNKNFKMTTLPYSATLNVTYRF